MGVDVDEARFGPRGMTEKKGNGLFVWRVNRRAVAGVLGRGLFLKEIGRRPAGETKALEKERAFPDHRQEGNPGGRLPRRGKRPPTV